MTDANQSSHVSTRFLRILEAPAIYSFSQTLTEARKLRRHFVNNFVRPFPGAKILDIGCGTGAILDYLPPGVNYVGLDLNPRHISRAKKKYRKQGQFYCSRVDSLASLGAVRPGAKA